jgi:hypothetical protein
MKASSIFDALRVLVAARQPVFVWGGPGIGKSAVIRQLADALKIALRDVRALLLDPVDLRGLFRPEDYSAPDELRSKFSFETKVMPLPDAGDFRVTLGEEEKERIKRQITAAVQASLQVASRDLWQRLYEAVSHLAERLQAYKVTEEGVENPFRNSVVTNLVKLVDVLPKLNVTGDPELERLASQVRASLLVNRQELRNSESIRSETAKNAATIAQRMQAYMGVYSVPEGRAA